MRAAGMTGSVSRAGAATGAAAFVGAAEAFASVSICA